MRQLAERDILAGVSLGRLYPGVAELDHGVVVTATETVTDDDIEALARGFAEVMG